MKNEKWIDDFVIMNWTSFMIFRFSQWIAMILIALRGAMLQSHKRMRNIPATIHYSLLLLTWSKKASGHEGPEAFIFLRLYSPIRDDIARL